MKKLLFLLFVGLATLTSCDKPIGTVYGNVIRPCSSSGRGRFTSNMDYTKDTENLLKLLGIKFESGNDSPRGGLAGNFIIVLTK